MYLHSYSSRRRRKRNLAYLMVTLLAIVYGLTLCLLTQVSASLK
jgi:hypothetical protein